MIMRKLLLILVVATVTSSSYGQSIPKWKITDVEKYMNETKGVLIINFWATFCKPCVAEIPSFIRLADKYKKDNVRLLLVSLDLPSYYPKRIADFAKKKKFNTKITWLNESNADIFCPRIDSSWSGSIPSTLILNTKTGYRKFFEEEITADVMEAEVRKAIGY